MTNFLLSPANDASLHRLPQATTPVPASSPHGQDTVHVLEPGQSPEEVASLHGVTGQALRMENDLGPGQAVYPGTPLRIPMPATSDSGSTEQAQAAGFAPFDPGSDQTHSSDNVATWVPDFKSMSPADIQKYLESPEFKQMAASEREVAERLYNAGMKQAAMDYLAASMKSLPAEVAARLAEECRDLLCQLAKEAIGNKKMYAVFAEVASVLVKSPCGQELVRELAHDLAGAMTEDQVRALLQSIHEGAPSARLLNILILKELLAKTKPESPLGHELRNAISGQINDVYQDYKSTQAERVAKDKDFAAILARLGASLTDEQKQALYRKYVSDPDNAAYEEAAKMAALMAGVASIAPGEVAAALLNRYKILEVTQLVDGLARSGQGMAALELLLALKRDPKVADRLDPEATQQLEQLAASAALAEAATATGDVQSGLKRVLRLLQGTVSDADSLIGKLNKVLTALEEVGGEESGSTRAAAELSALLKQAGPWANVIGGLLSMAVALTSTTETQFDASLRALIDGFSATVGTASDIVSILSGLAKPESLLKADFEKISKVLGLAGKALGILSNSIEVAESIHHMVENGAPNGGDITSMIGALVGIGAAIAGTGPVGAVLALASMAIMMAGEMIRNYDKEQELLSQFTGYLQQIGMDPVVARNLLRNPLTSQRLASLGFDAGQIQQLAKQSWLFDGGWSEFGFMRLASAMKHAGLESAAIMDVLSEMGDQDARNLCDALADNISLQDAFADVKNTPGLIAALERAMEVLPAGKGHDAAEKLLNQLHQH